MNITRIEQLIVGGVYKSIYGEFSTIERIYAFDKDYGIRTEIISTNDPHFDDNSKYYRNFGEFIGSATVTQLYNFKEYANEIRNT